MSTNPRLQEIVDKRWTIKDKITQYKGLVALYNADKKIKGRDKIIAKNQQHRECIKVNKALAIYSGKLDQVLVGDRQRIRNLLQVDKRLLLAYQNLSLEEIIEHVHQDTFNLKKTLDQQKCKLETKANKLMQLKLDIALYQNILANMEASTSREVQSKIVTAQIQDVILKQDAALRVKVIYKDLLIYMKNDCIYMDMLLKALQNDLSQQSHCMIRTTELGQLASEQLDDYRRQYTRMKAIINKNEKDIKNELSDFTKEGRTLDLKVIKSMREKSVESVASDILHDELEKNTAELHDLEDIFTELRTATQTANIFDILPCLEKQKEHAQKLKDLLQKISPGKNKLKDKVDHANISLNSYHCTIQNETEEYNLETQKLEKDIKEQDEIILKSRTELQNLNDLFAKLNVAMMEIEIACNHIKLPSRKKKELSSPSKKIFAEKEAMNKQHTFLPKFKQMYNKIKLLVNKLQGVNVDDTKNRSQDMYVKLMQRQWEKFATKKINERDSSDMIIQDSEESQIPTRDSIKEEGSVIVVKGTTEKNAN